MRSRWLVKVIQHLLAVHTCAADTWSHRGLPASAQGRRGPSDHGVIPSAGDHVMELRRTGQPLARRGESCIQHLLNAASPQSEPTTRCIFAYETTILLLTWHMAWSRRVLSLKLSNFDVKASPHRRNFHGLRQWQVTADLLGTISRDSTQYPIEFCIVAQMHRARSGCSCLIQR